MAIADPRLVELLTRPVNDVLLDRAVRHAVFLERFKTGQVNRVLGFLNDEVFPEITEQVRSRLGRIAARGFDTGLHSTKRLRDLEQAVAGELASGMRTARKEFTGQMQAFAKVESQWQANVLSQTTKPWLEFDWNVPNARALNSIVTARPFNGKIMRTWFRDVEQSTRRNIGGAINRGIALGETNEQIARRLTGTRARSFTDGVYQTTRHNARTTVRTAVTHVSNHAREATYAENGDVVKGVQWVSTLDDRTTFICMGLDGQVFKINEGDRPPAHPQCRSTTVAVLKSWKELGINLKEAPASTRAALSGQVPSEITYPSWFKQQPAAFQREVLGPSRFNLFKEGRFTLDRFVDGTGKTLNLNQLRTVEGLTKTKRPRKQSTPRPANTPPKLAAPKPANATGEATRKALLGDSSVKAAGEALDKLNKRADVLIAELRSIRTLKTGATVERFEELRRELVGIRKELQRAGATARKAALKHLEVKNGAQISLLKDRSKLRDKTFSSRLDVAQNFLSKVISRDRIDRLNIDFERIRKGSRSYATRGKIHVAGGADFRVFVHEMGHVLEFADTEVTRRANAFLWKRAAADPKGLQRLSRITGNSRYGVRELAWEDKFINPYIGRDYRRGSFAGVSKPGTVTPGVVGPATEVVSMGLELLYADPVGFARKDPGMFDFIVDLLRGAP